MENQDNMQVEVVLEKLTGLEELIKEKFNQNAIEHESICKKQDHTNGDVTMLKLWRAYLVGAWAVCSIILVGIMVPLLVNYFKNTSTDSIKRQVISAIEEYDKTQTE